MAEEKKTKDGDAQPEQATPATSGTSKKKLLLIVGGVVLLLLLVGVPLAFFALNKGEKKDHSELDADAASSADHTVPEGIDDEDELDEGEEPIGAIFPLESLAVNLSGGGYLRAQIQLEFVERDVPSRFYLRLVPIRDGLIGLLASRKSDEINSQTGRDNLKRDIKELVNEILRREEVKNVYFTQFVIQ